jgi:hypothetical protein
MWQSACGEVSDEIEQILVSAPSRSVILLAMCSAARASEAELGILPGEIQDDSDFSPETVRD